MKKTIILNGIKIKFVENAITYGLTYFNDYLEDLVLTINPEQESFAKLNTSNLFSSNGKSEIILILENTVNFASELQVFTLSEDDMLEALIFSYIIGASANESNKLLELLGYPKLYVKKREDFSSLLF